MTIDELEAMIRKKRKQLDALIEQNDKAEDALHQEIVKAEKVLELEKYNAGLIPFCKGVQAIVQTGFDAWFRENIGEPWWPFDGLTVDITGVNQESQKADCRVSGDNRATRIPYRFLKTIESEKEHS